MVRMYGYIFSSIATRHQKDCFYNQNLKRKRLVCVAIEIDPNLFQKTLNKPNRLFILSLTHQIFNLQLDHGLREIVRVHADSQKILAWPTIKCILAIKYPRGLYHSSSLTISSSQPSSSSSFLLSGINSAITGPPSSSNISFTWSITSGSEASASALLITL